MTIEVMNDLYGVPSVPLVVPPAKAAAVPSGVSVVPCIEPGNEAAQRLQPLECELPAHPPLATRDISAEGLDAKPHWAWKTLGAAFATLVAPLLVAIGSKYTDVILPPAASDSPSPTTAAMATTAVTTGPVEKPASSPATLPPEVRLFNGRDLTGFSKYLGPAAAGQKPLGKNHDPQHVFSVRKGILRVSGETTGALLSNREYQNYHLTVEYKWGEKTWSPRTNRARMNGILLHAGKLDGIVRDAWPSAIKCQISEGSTGDLVILAPEANHRVHLVFPGEMRTSRGDGKSSRVFYYYQPDAPLTTFSSGVVRATTTDLDWRDEKGHDKKSDSAESHDGWHTLECICQGDKLQVAVNGRTINEAAHVQPQHGRVGIVSQGAEIFFRRIDLQPLAP